MHICQPSNMHLQLQYLYSQKGLLYPNKMSRDSQSYCISCSCPHRFHHQTLFVVALKARKHALIYLPPLPGMKGETLLKHMIRIRHQRYHNKKKEQKVSDDFHIRSPTKNHQKGFMRVDYQRVLEGIIMAYVCGGVNLKHAATTRLDNLATETNFQNENVY